MNFYDEAIEAKDRLRVQFASEVSASRELADAIRAEAQNAKSAKMIDWFQSNQNRYNHYRPSLEAADPYFWDARITQLVIAAAQQLPQTIKFEPSWLYGTGGYWWFGRLSPLIGVSDNNARKYVNALFWTLNPNGSLSVQTFYVDGSQQRILGDITWEEGTSLTEAIQKVNSSRPPNVDTPNVEFYRLRSALCRDESPIVQEKAQACFHEWQIASRNALITFACGCLWLQQKIVVLGEGRVSRAARRRLERANISTNVRVVYLRSKSYAPTSPDHEAKHVDWAWQWAVKGHWRDQPTKEGSKLIWIHPYIKGPEDKPLKPDAARVFAVTR